MSLTLLSIHSIFHRWGYTSISAAGALTVVCLLAGCATFRSPALTDNPPATIVARPLPTGKLPVALVLSGGSARGFAHVGVIKVLEANGLRPDIIVGTSAGSIVGALYASGLSAAELDSAVAQMDRSVFTDTEGAFEQSARIGECLDLSGHSLKGSDKEPRGVTRSCGSNYCAARC